MNLVKGLVFIKIVIEFIFIIKEVIINFRDEVYIFLFSDLMS